MNRRPDGAAGRSSPRDRGGHQDEGREGEDPRGSGFEPTGRLVERHERRVLLRLLLDRASRADEVEHRDRVGEQRDDRREKPPQDVRGPRAEKATQRRLRSGGCETLRRHEEQNENRSNAPGL